MKKLLSLVLVLAFASLANAIYPPSYDTISMTLQGDNTPGSGTINLYVVPNPLYQLDVSMAVCLKGTGTLSAGTIGASAPADSQDNGVDMADIDAYYGTSLVATYGNGELWTMLSFTSVYPTGVWLTVNYSGAVAGDTITAYQSVDGNFDDIYLQSNTITIIPEPATIALLCLGGLVLRKKRS
jgi:hypothetical protein